MNEWTIRVSIACVFTLLGWIIGHRLALGREKRKEFNQAVEPIRHLILGNKIVTLKDINALESKLGSESKLIRKTFIEIYEPNQGKMKELYVWGGYGGPKIENQEEYDRLNESAKNALMNACKLK